MDTRREKAAGAGGDSSIRLRYSRQFQSGGHAHTIDAEAVLPVGASQEAREQVIHELEIGVEQLARQIIQHATRVSSDPRSPAQAPGRSAPGGGSGSAIPMVSRPVEQARPSREAAETVRQSPSTGLSIPATRTAPVSESMPTSPGASGEGLG